MDIVRVLRVIEYVGPRNAVEAHVKLTLHGEKTFQGITVRAATVNPFPEILEKPEDTIQNFFQDKLP